MPHGVCAPSQVMDLAARAGDNPSTQVLLSWTVPTASSGILLGYEIRFVTGTNSITTRNWSGAILVGGTPIPGVTGTMQSMTVSVTPGTTYKFALKSRDASGWSVMSNVAITISRSLTKDVTLAWNASSSEGKPLFPDLAYRMYWGTSSGQYAQSQDVGNAKQFTVQGLTWGVTYYYAVKAFSLVAGQESVFSNEVSENK